MAQRRGTLTRLAPSEHDDAGDGSRATHVVREADLRILHLTTPRLPAELGHALVYHAPAARADRMTERLEAAARIHRDVALERRPTFLDEPQIGRASCRERG